MIPSDDETDRPLIRNEETLRRRAWIDSALAAVRSRLAGDDGGRTARGPVSGGSPPEVLAAASPDLPPASPGPSRPRLHLVRNAGPR